MKTYEEKLIFLIKEYLHHIDKLRELISYLYNHTELFEKRYEQDYQHDLFDYFASKINLMSKYENTLLKIMTEKQIEELNYQRMIER